MLDRGAISKKAVIETIHLADELRGMRPASFDRLEHAVVFGLVAPEQQHIINIEKLHVDELILYILYRRPGTDDMRNDRRTISLLDGGSDGYRARTAPDAQLLILPVRRLAIDILRVMRRDVNIVRSEIPHLVDIVEEGCRSVTLERRKHLNGKAFRTVCIFKYLCDIHSRELFSVQS